MNQEQINKKIRQKPNVLSWRVDLTKIKNGVDTKIPCITVYVLNKIERKLLAPREVIPKTINGTPTDVIALDPKGDFELGETPIGNKTPEQQKRLMGVKK